MDWVYLIEVLVGGLMSGVMYSLVAIGFVLIYKSSGIFNFAQGTMLLFASLTFVKMTENNVDFWTAIIVALGIMVVFGILTEKFVIRPLANQDLLALFMATVGLATFQEGFSQFIWDSDVHGLQLGKFLDLALLDPVPIFVADHIPWLDILIPKFDIFASIVAGTLIVSLAFFFQKTRTGLSLRAVSDDHMAAMAVGIPLQKVWAVVWAVTGMIALVAGLLWAERISVSFTLIEAVMKGLPVILIGGLTSIPGAIIGGLVIGVGEKLGEIYLADLMGGQGIEKLNFSMNDLSDKLKKSTKNFKEKIMVQKFIERVYEGDKRILVINGRPSEYAVVRTPAMGEFKGNLAAGGIASIEKLNKIELSIASKIAPKLKERGILIAGLDIVGDFLTEINITCPTCFRELLDKKGINLMEEVFNFVES